MVEGALVAPQSLSVGLAAWAAWLPQHGTMVAGGAVRDGGALPVSLRRRITPIGRKALEAAWAVLDPRAPPPRIVLSSRHGEYARTFDLLSALAETGEVSPAEFSLAVHHGLAGLLSIATGNRAGHVAVACGGESFGYGLLEAAISLAEGEDSVLLMHFDEPLPDIYAPVSDPAEPAVALALLLTARGPGRALAFDLAPAPAPGRDPLALRFSALLTGEAGEAVAAGERMTWRWRLAA